jgi:hypothetical protein
MLHTLLFPGREGISRNEGTPQAQVGEILTARLLILNCGSALSLFHHKLNRGPHHFTDLHIYEFRDEHDIIAILGKVFFG